MYQSSGTGCCWVKGYSIPRRRHRRLRHLIEELIVVLVAHCIHELLYVMIHGMRVRNRMNIVSRLTCEQPSVLNVPRNLQQTCRTVRSKFPVAWLLGTDGVSAVNDDDHASGHYGQPMKIMRLVSKNFVMAISFEPRANRVCAT